MLILSSMITTPLFCLSKRHVTLTIVFCVLVCGLTAFALSPNPPESIIEESTAPALPSPSPPSPASPHVAPRRTLVREVDRLDWHLLDGDQLLPVHLTENKKVLSDRRQARFPEADQDATQATAGMEKVKPASLTLAEPRRLAPLRLQRVKQPGSPLPNEEQQRTTSPLTPAIPAEHSVPAGRLAKESPVLSKAAPTEEGGDGTAKIALQSLRLVVRLADGESEEGRENIKASPVEHRQPLLATRSTVGGPAILLAGPHAGPSPYGPAQRVHVSPDAPTEDALSPPKEKEIAFTTADKTSKVARASYTDEELRRRCVVANGRATESAVLHAMVEGRLRKDCLIVEADVGNDIPTNENNAKGAVTLVSLLVCTLFLVFAFIF
ncbi:hypothetical protein ABL78_4558 [Leptomonas seymouri]|uniref:Uncharacterized protein n=1 Tax=Leptomonas seymouri TaxID=5684 RepID=A0A0N1I683_LEPSE|nr:hypothetical protein ABL78_4558 [Leptomonas seymouri]|eukprot:KPI86372.1 hypothetical protein ABL78_4558 [Leptomonas seymouri]